MVDRNNYENAIAVTREIFWVGFREQSTKLHCNPYLLMDQDEAVLFDPGSIPDFPVVMRKVIDQVNPSAISTIVICHQDPDCCGNLAVVEDVIDRRDLKILAHSNTNRLIRHLGLKSELVAVDQNDYSYSLKNGRTFQFLHAHYLHAPGAIVTYDEKSRSLFSGDLFGGVGDEWSLFGSEAYFDSISAFHQIYMPSNRILKGFLEKLKNLDIDRILPQHGSVLEDQLVGKVIDHLCKLPCGMDCLEEGAS